ncbi:protein kinase [Fragilaria crotonensis]|nr:protein kinase [Fragilaria crotonensis]
MTAHDDEAMAAADKEMEERANRVKHLLSQRYQGLKNDQEEKHARKMQLERKMIGLPEERKQNLRNELEQEEISIQKETRKAITTADFESLVVVGRGAFGEVRLVRRKTPDKTDPSGGQIFALKSMKKEMMVLKNQVGHVKAERDILAKADESNRWLTVLHYSFTDATHLYMVMDFMPGGDLMSLLMKEDTFSESVTRFFMAEAAFAISSVHALGYIHRDIKPDNMLLDARGHLKLTDLGLCKKVGDISPRDHPDFIIEMMKKQDLSGPGASNDWNNTQMGNGGGFENRIGSSVPNGEFTNGFQQIIAHPWYRGFDWEHLGEVEGPLLPAGAAEFPELLEYLKTCPKSDPRFEQLVQRVTQNFDTFEDYGSNLDQEGGRQRANVVSLDQFYDYSYRRPRKPRVPIPEA